MAEHFTGDGAPSVSAGCRFSNVNSCIFILILQRAKVSKCHQRCNILAVSTPILRPRRTFQYFSEVCQDPANTVENKLVLRYSRKQALQSMPAQSVEIPQVFPYCLCFDILFCVYLHFDICENLHPVRTIC